MKSITPAYLFEFHLAAMEKDLAEHESLPSHFERHPNGYCIMLFHGDLYRRFFFAVFKNINEFREKGMAVFERFCDEQGTETGSFTEIEYFE